MSEPAIDLTACDREPIHIPGSIQPHGLLFVTGRDDLVIRHAAGDVVSWLGDRPWEGRSLGEVTDDVLAGRIARLADSNANGGFAGRWRSAEGRAFDVSVHRTGAYLAVEMEPGPDEPTAASAVMGLLEAAGAGFERATNLKALCERAASEFRLLTGFDRVMIYQFLDDDAGAVLAEDRDPALPSFLNHHFPGSDIPRQARALYVRNLVRVIPDVDYVPAPLQPAWTDPEPLDMSDCALRSVSPVHMQYLRNMGVGASASISIVKDGVLWGLIACHHMTPRLLPYDIRAAARALAGGLARQIRAKEDAEAYRERIRLRSFEDDVLLGLSEDLPLDAALVEGAADLQRMLDADGVAILRGGELTQAGSTPHEADTRQLGAWIAARGGGETFATDRLAEAYPPAARYAEAASGVLAVAISPDEPFLILWFRAEAVEVVNWAGNPHKAAELAPGETLSPRASFEAWSDTVRGRSRPWRPAEAEAAGRLRRALLEVRQSQRLRGLNSRLSETLADRESLLQQKEFLLREVNHRVQNSLQLVSSFLGLQARASDDPALREAVEEARRRLSAVALVHRRLYRADQIENVDLARYIEELCGEMLESMGAEWRDQISLDLAPILIPPDRAVTIGLILTELVINANKYAYGGGPGRIEISLEQHRSALRLIIADHGKGQHEPRQGFGTRMMAAMVAQLSGTLEQSDNKPGLRAILTAPVLPGR
jgi:light-regulated signal transduction histidine kinase (bacteriophytochrome)